MNIINIKNFLKTLLKYLVTYLLLLIIFICTLSFTSLIPKSLLEENVKESSEQLESQGLYPTVGILKNIVLDNYTDALMINTVYSIDSKNILESILMARRSYDSNREIVEVDNSTIYENPIEDLKNFVSESNTTCYEYARYWHGYMIFLRPLLLVFNYNTIRIILMAILNILGLILAVLLYKKVSKGISLILVLSLFLVSYQYAGLSLTYFSVLCISIISSIYVVFRKKINYKDFFIIGRVN